MKMFSSDFKRFASLFLLCCSLKISTVSAYSCSSSSITDCKVDEVTMTLCCTNLSTIPDPNLAPPNFSQAPLKKCYHLYLNQSCVRDLNSDILSKYTNLNALGLKNNHIEVLRRDTFKRLSELRILDLSNNAISRIKDGALSGLYILHELYLSNNRLAKLLQNSFQDLTNLTVLKMNDNALKSLPEIVFKPLGKLLTLDLSGNSIMTFTKLHFSGLNNLRGLFLQRNKLEQFASVVNATTLVELDLRNNSLKLLDEKVFKSHHTHLAIVRIGGNQLETPQSSWFRQMYINNKMNYFDDEEELLTSNNPWSCDCTILHYWSFLAKELRGKDWASMLDITCAQPADLKGKRLKDLAYNDIILNPMKPKNKCIYAFTTRTHPTASPSTITPGTTGTSTTERSTTPESTTTTKTITTKVVPTVIPPASIAPISSSLSVDYILIAAVSVLLVAIITTVVGMKRFRKRKRSSSTNQTLTTTATDETGSNRISTTDSVETQEGQTVSTNRSDTILSVSQIDHQFTHLHRQQQTRNNEETIPKVLHHSGTSPEVQRSRTSSYATNQPCRNNYSMPNWRDSALHTYCSIPNHFDMGAERPPSLHNDFRLPPALPLRRATTLRDVQRQYFPNRDRSSVISFEF